MAAAVTSDGSENVEDFLRRIQSLGSQQDDEDAQRMRKLDEDILESRKQREARRNGMLWTHLISSRTLS